MGLEELLASVQDKLRLILITDGGKTQLLKKKHASHYSSFTKHFPTIRSIDWRSHTAAPHQITRHWEWRLVWLQGTLGMEERLRPSQKWVNRIPYTMWVFLKERINGRITWNGSCDWRLYRIGLLNEWLYAGMKSYTKTYTMSSTVNSIKTHTV